VKVIVRPPTEAFSRALSSHPDRGLIDPDRASWQHRRFVAALEEARIDVVVLPPEPDLPDAAFVSDTMVALADPGRASPGVIVMTRPGAPSRRREVASVEAALRSMIPAGARVDRIEPPATLDGGDVVVYGDRIAIGVSARTDRLGAERLAAIAQSVGYRAFLCPVLDRLHLATAVTALGPSRLVGTRAGFASLEAADGEALDGVERVVVPETEGAAANVLSQGGLVFVLAGHPVLAGMLRDRGEHVVEVDLDEFVRADGGPTCLVAVVP
jgi:dimethylargininase